MAFEADPEKVETFYLHILKSAQKFRHKQIAREQLVKQLSSLKKMKVNKAFKQKIEALEQSIQAVVNTEKRILKAQEQEGAMHHALKDKIGALEQKMGAYVKIQEERKKRVVELEVKVQERLEKREANAAVQGEIEGLEIMYHKLKRKGVDAPELMDRIGDRIKDLKNRMRAV